MSGLWSIYRWDGGAVDPEDFDLIGDALRHRGQRAPQALYMANVAMGHCMLTTTPESVDEILPFYHRARECVITADARLDNRDELRAMLDQANPSLPDSALILAAYEKWGDQCAEHLLGDFAFIIWDRRQQRLFCARDPFGVKPLFFATTRDQIIFASEAAALFRAQGVTPEVNRTTLACFLAGLLDDEEDTFHVAVKRLRRGHVLTCHLGNVVQRQYYTLDPTRHTVLRDDREYAEAFREHFERAVMRRLRCAGRPGFMLSGGLDSSAITCVAHHLLGRSGDPISTFSWVFPKRPACDESAYINAVLESGSFAPHFFAATNDHAFDNLGAFLGKAGAPLGAVGLFSLGSLYSRVRSLGHPVVMDGHGGDEVVSLGYARLRELALEGQWGEFTREWLALARANHGWKLSQLIRVYYRFSPFGKYARRLAPQSKNTKTVSRVRPELAHVHSQLSQDAQLPARYTEYSKRIAFARTERDAHFNTLAHSGQSRRFEELDAAAAAAQIEPRYPFWDRQLVEFCLSVPSRQKLSRGATRVVMRRGLAGVLPEKIRNRRSKTDFTAHAESSLRALGRDNLLNLAGTAGHEIVDPNWYTRRVNGLFGYSDATHGSVHTLWRCIASLMWLEAVPPSGGHECETALPQFLGSSPLLRECR